MELVEFYEVLVQRVQRHRDRDRTSRPDTLDRGTDRHLDGAGVGRRSDDGGYSLSRAVRRVPRCSTAGPTRDGPSPRSHTSCTSTARSITAGRAWFGRANTGQLYFTAEEFEMNTDAEPASVTVNGEGNGAEFEGSGRVATWGRFRCTSPAKTLRSVPCRWHLGCSPSREQDGLWRR